MDVGSNQDILLWLQFKDGSREAFAAIYERHGASLIAYGFRLCSDRERLKDQVQELFAELWHSRKNISRTDNVKFYLFKALRYKLIRSEKAMIRLSVVHTTAWIDSFLSEDPVEKTIVEREFQESQTAMLKRAIRTLSVRQQEAIHLRYYQGFSNEQIAQLMALNYQSVSNIIYKALDRLKEAVLKNVPFS